MGSYLPHKDDSGGCSGAAVSSWGSASRPYSSLARLNQLWKTLYSQVIFDLSFQKNTPGGWIFSEQWSMEDVDRQADYSSAARQQVIILLCSSSNLNDHMDRVHGRVPHLLCPWMWACSVHGSGVLSVLLYPALLKISHGLIFTFPSPFPALHLPHDPHDVPLLLHHPLLRHPLLYIFKFLEVLQNII